MTYEEVYKKYRTQLESFCRYKIGPADEQIAEDLISEVFLLLYQKWALLDSYDEARLLRWLYNAALIKIREHRRLTSKKPLIYSLEEHGTADGSLFDEPLYHNGGADEALMYGKYLEQIKAVLTEKDRQTFELKVEKQYTIAQIAGELQTSKTAIKVRWHRIQRKLKERMSDF